MVIGVHQMQLKASTLFKREVSRISSIEFFGSNDYLFR